MIRRSWMLRCSGKHDAPVDAERKRPESAGFFGDAEQRARCGGISGGISCGAISWIFRATAEAQRVSPSFWPVSRFSERQEFCRCEDKVAGVERGFLEIRGIDGKKLPAGHFLAQQPDGPHMGKLRAQSWVMLFDCG